MQDPVMRGLREFAWNSTKSSAQKDSPGELGRLSHRLHVLADGEFAKYQNERARVACRRGCCHCCYGIIHATIPELVEIAQTVSGWSPEDRASLEDRCETYVRGADDFWKYDSELIDSPCPFLVDDQCAIYDHRPLFCRAANSNDSDACKQNRLGIPTPIGRRPWQDAICGSLIRGIIDGLADCGCASGTYELGSAIRMLLTHPDPHLGLPEESARQLARYQLQSSRGEPERLSEWAKSFRSEPIQALIRSPASLERIRAADSLTTFPELANLFRVFLPPFYASDDERQEWIHRYQSNLNRVIESKINPRLGFEALYFGALESFYLPYAGVDVTQIKAQLMGFAHREFAMRAFPELASPIESRRKPGKLRLGYISLNLANSNGSRWALGWAQAHSPDIETYAFQLGMTEDLVTYRWRRNCDYYFHLPYTAPRIVEIVRDLDLDAIIFTDIGSDPITTQLSLLRLARYQMAAWGIPVTSASPAIDAYLSSEDMEPDDAQDHYCETLVKLPGSGTSYPRASWRPSQKSLEELCLPTDGYYLITQNAIKLLPHRDAIYREISERVGKPIVMFRPIPAHVGDQVATRMSRAGARVVSLPRLSASDYLRVIELSDCVLDSFDFGGGITTIDTMNLGKPLVSCKGKYMRSRLTIPFLRQSGVEALLVNDEREYIELACDPDRIATCMQSQNPIGMYRDQRAVQALDELVLSLKP